MAFLDIIIIPSWTLTLHCRGVHSNELGHSMSPLMSRAFEPTTINICFDQPLACRSKLHNEGVRTKISSFQQFFTISIVANLNVSSYDN